jgi:uncharacterized membrane protein YedE/YeeE
MLSALLGGALIGLAATVYWVGTGRVAGVSGLLRGALREGPARSDSVLFLLGLVAAGVIASLARVQATALPRPLWLLLGAGLLVGFGTRVGGGCTSGHGVCGLARFSGRSFVATLTFIATAAATVFVVGHLVLAGGSP